MKSKKIKIDGAAKEFWEWFSSVAPLLAADPENPPILKQLDERVSQMHPKLSWEIGPGLYKPWQFVISPNLDAKLRKTSAEVIKHCPGLTDWEFYGARQPKQWDYNFQLQIAGMLVDFDASRWKFVLLRYPDGMHEILLKGENLPKLTAEQRQQAAAITLESILGEDVILQSVDEFELLNELEPRFASKARPIQQLREAVLGSD
jgi:hypothetical protein